MPAIGQPCCITMRSGALQGGQAHRDMPGWQASRAIGRIYAAVQRQPGQVTRET